MAGSQNSPDTCVIEAELLYETVKKMQRLYEAISIRIANCRLWEDLHNSRKCKSRHSTHVARVVWSMNDDLPALDFEHMRSVL